MENLELREQVFRKIGWTTGRHLMQKADWDYLWIDNNGRQHENGLPPIETSWEVCAQYLVPFMRGKNITYQTKFLDISSSHEQKGGYFFYWEAKFKTVGYKEIISDNISEAACRAFLEVME